MEIQHETVSKPSVTAVSINHTQILQTAKQVLVAEQQAIAGLLDTINDNFIKAVELLMQCQARIVVTGIGKSGHIGRKIAASFASLGSPAFFLHAAEAQHGDFGMITSKDVVIALSYSGTTNEVLSLIPSLKHINVPIIAITGRADSELAGLATIHLPINVDKEACHLNLAPTTSTTATLALGDALVIVVTKAKQFAEQDFAKSHPGGNLGRRLLLKVSDIMVKGEDLPLVTPECKITDALIVMSNKRLGMLAIADQGKVQGIFTDGDLRRLFNTQKIHHLQDLATLNIKDVMNSKYISISPDILATSAWDLIREKNINGLVVLDNTNNLIGMLNIHTLTHAKII